MIFLKSRKSSKIKHCARKRDSLKKDGQNLEILFFLTNKSIRKYRKKNTPHKKLKINIA